MRSLLEPISLKYNIRDLKYLLREKRDPNVIKAIEEISYTLYKDYDMTYYNISKVINRSTYTVHKALIRYIIKNKLKLYKRTKHHVSLEKYTDILENTYKIPRHDARAVLAAVYKLGYRAGHWKGMKSRNFDQNSFSGVGIVPSDENNAPVTLLEAPRGLLNEVVDEQIQPPDRVKTAYSSG
jgi:hypothetical protein